MAFSLPPLPYPDDALAPHVSAQTLQFHHGKHHQAYVDKANAAIEGTPLAALEEAEIVRRANAEGNAKLFDNAAQAWNHRFLWQSMRPAGGSAPSGELAAALVRDFGSVEAFGEQFKAAAAGHFGSGWAWLVQGADGLKIITTHDADTPLVHDGLTPLLTLDLWEHAYYLDVQNARPKYIDGWLSALVNWDFAAANMH